MRRSAQRNERPRAPIPLTLRDVMVGRVAAHAAAFEGRWRLSSLRRVDPDLAVRFEEQQALWHAALAGPDDDAVRHQGEAMLRGWDAAIVALERAMLNDNAYLIGYDQASDTRVVIADRVAVGATVGGSLSPGGIFLTPDEVAVLVASLGPAALAVKREWAQAALVDIRERTI